MSRSFGWTLLTTRSPIEIVPEVMFSRPASMRSKVDLPHPEGPTRTTNSPSSIGIDTPCRTSKLPNDFRTSRIWTDDIHFPPCNSRRRTTDATTTLLIFLPTSRLFEVRSDCYCPQFIRFWQLFD